MEFFIRSNKQYVISEQSPTELQLIMRGIYLQHSKGADDIQQQVVELDNIIVSWSVPKIINEIEQFRGYVHDLEKSPCPIGTSNKFIKCWNKSTEECYNNFLIIYNFSES